MTAAICVDFGTSSIRAAFRDPNDELHVIPLGQLAGERRLDGASLMSEIFVDRKIGSLSFGEKAYTLGLKSSRDAYFKSSAKLWLKNPGLLSQIEVQELGLTREHLLVGLLAYAFNVTLSANSKLRLQDNVRVAHPIWEREQQDGSNLALESITAKAIVLAEGGFQNPLPVAALKRVFGGMSNAVNVLNGVDVIEPIAAAQQLIPHQQNLRKIVVVVDVGAGTTDLGLFLYKEPSATKGRKLGQSAIVPITQARSVIKAGNLVDHVLLRILFAKVLRLSPEDRREAEAEVRRLKEKLFKEGRLTHLGCTIEQQEIEQDKEIQEFARDVRANLEDMIAESSAMIKATTVNQAYQVPYVEIIMAGGGATLSFLVEKLKEPMKGDEINVEFRVAMPSVTKLRCYEASIGRLAVALGGVQAEYDDLRKNYEVAPPREHTLGSPKQTFANSGDSTARGAGKYEEAQLWWDFPTDPSKRVSAAPPGVNTAAPPKPDFSFANAASPTTKQSKGDAVSQWQLDRERLLKAAKSRDPARECQLALHLLSAPSEQLRRMYLKTSLGCLESLVQKGYAEAAFHLARYHTDNARRFYFLQVWRIYGSDRHREVVKLLESEISSQLGNAEIVSCKRDAESWVSAQRKQRPVQVPAQQVRPHAKVQVTDKSRQVDSTERLLQRLEGLVSKYKK
jgi:molecular chaperone HscA